jgi:preprotein translocase subunit SecB
MPKNTQTPHMSLNKAANEHDHKETTAPVFNVHSFYVKDLSFEAPHSPEVFNKEWKPKIDFDLQMGSQVLSEPESIYEVVLHVTVTIKLGEAAEEKPAFLIDIKQAGAFTVRDFTPEVTQQLLATACATVLFPYAREAVSNLATRGGFPQFVLPPINFDAMYEHHLKTRDKSIEPHAEQSH